MSYFPLISIICRTHHSGCRSYYCTKQSLVLPYWCETTVHALLKAALHACGELQRMHCAKQCCAYQAVAPDEQSNEHLAHACRYGFIVMDGNGSLFGTLSGNTREVLHKFTVDLPKKHGRGGQSALRFARLRMEKRHNYVRKVRRQDLAAVIWHLPAEHASIALP